MLHHSHRDSAVTVELVVKVIPNAKETQLQWQPKEDPPLRLRLAAPAVEGKANQALIRFWATFLKIPQRQVLLVAGAKCRVKRLLIHGVTPESLQITLQTTFSSDV